MANDIICPYRDRGERGGVLFRGSSGGAAAAPPRQLLPAPAAAAYQQKLIFRMPFLFIIKRKGAAATAIAPGQLNRLKSLAGRNVQLRGRPAARRSAGRG